MLLMKETQNLFTDDSLRTEHFNRIFCNSLTL